jgi:rRNA maturation RNase YbeY
MKKEKKTSNAEQKKLHAATAFLTLAAFIVTLICLVWGAGYEKALDAQIGSVSRVRIKAPRDVENKLATDKLRNEAYVGAQKVYAKDVLAAERTAGNIKAFFVSVEEVRARYSELLNQLENPPSGSVDTRPGIEAQIKECFSDSSFRIHLADNRKNLILQMGSNEFNNLQVNVIETMNQTLESGALPEESARNSVLLKARTDFGSIYAGGPEEFLAYDIFSAYFEPNFVEDEEATEENRLKNMAAVEPVMFKEGQLIVDDGQVITEEIYAVLTDLGFVRNDYKDFLRHAASSVGASLTVFLVLFYYAKSFYEPKLEPIKARSMLCVFYCASLIFTWAVGINLPDYQIFIPILFFVLLIAVLIEIKFAIIINVALSTFAVFIADIDLKLYLYFILAGIITSALSKNLSKRRNYSLVVAVMCGAVNACVFTGIYFYDKQSGFAFLLTNFAFCFVNGFLTVILAMGSLPIWEAVFGAETTIRLLELTDPENELLSRLAVETPGTYHHCLIVANLAEAAAKDVGADTVSVRVGAYYHDVGKLRAPANFTENGSSESPHDKMTPYESSDAIKDHVTYGLELAEKYKLPQIVKDMIATHHGNSLIKYFYDKALKDENYDGVNPSDFRYGGPIPQSKELGIIMLADTIEAAVRSRISDLKSASEVGTFIRKLINDKIQDGQLLESCLTLKDIEKVISAFTRVFKGMYHQRIAYPGDKFEEKEYEKFLQTANIITSNRSGAPIRADDEILIAKTIFQTLVWENRHYKVEVSVSIVSDEEIKKLNFEYRNIDEATDVLSFPLIEHYDVEKEFKKGETVYLGDIVLAINFIKAQAEEYGHPFSRELALLTAHSVLHLLGFDHEGVETEKIMSLKQEQILQILGV